jgi:hypothetical protein
VSVAGGSFGAAGVEPTSSFSNVQHGAYGVDYHYPSEQTLRFLASRGIKLVRIDFRWERIQPNVYGPLDPVELDQLKQTVEQASAAGLKVLLDLHNYGSYYRFDGRQGVRQTIGSATLPLGALADVWRGISATFKDHPGIAAYGLMNEPAELADQYVPRLMFESFEDERQPWIPDAIGSDLLTLDRQHAHGGSTSLRLEKSFPMERAYGHFRVHDDGASLARYPQLVTLGDILACWVFLPADAPGTHWEARLFLNARDLAVDATTSVGLARGQWTLVTGRFALPHVRALHGIGVQVYANDVAGPAWIALDDFSIGDGVGPAQLWEQASQRAVDAIRDQGDRQLLMVSGYGWSRPQDWFEQHPTAWVRDRLANVRYESHHYWDRNRAGVYGDSYSSELIAARESAS